jgi:hypothetical protein
MVLLLYPPVPILSLQCIQCKVWSQCPVIVCLMRSEFYLHSQFPLFEPIVSVSVPDPNPDPRVFWPPGSGSTSQRYRMDADPDPSIIMQKC